jgi:hypothetical protein
MGQQSWRDNDKFGSFQCHEHPTLRFRCLISVVIPTMKCISRNRIMVLLYGIVMRKAEGLGSIAKMPPKCFSEIQNAVRSE